MSGIRFRSDIHVEEVQDGCCGGDQLVAHAAWVMPPLGPVQRHGKQDNEEGWRRVIRAMMQGCPVPQHNGPFEQGRMTVYVEAPGVVWWQWTRQRFMSIGTEDFSFDLESGRYKVLDGVFYLPPRDRPCKEPDDFKPLRPRLEGDAGAQELAGESIKTVARVAWNHYRHLTDRGVAREAARLCLPNWALYCAGYVGAGPLSWLQWFGKRRRTPQTAVATFPAWEIEQAAARCEELFAARWPLAYSVFCENGRHTPQ